MKIIDVHSHWGTKRGCPLQKEHELDWLLLLLLENDQKIIPVLLRRLTTLMRAFCASIHI